MNRRSPRQPPLQLALCEIVNREWEIEDGEEGERQQVHFEEVERAIIRKNIKEGFRFRFVKEKTVIEAGEMIGCERDDEVKFGPEKDANNGESVWSKMMGQHQKNDADDDAAVGNEKAEEANVGKPEAEIRCQNCLQGSTDSPEISDLEPTLASAQHRNDHDYHSPIAQLQRQHLLPADNPAVKTHKNQIRRVIQNEQNR